LNLDSIQTRLRPHVSALAPGIIGVALMLVWAVHDGGYDADTWYWGALVSLAALAGAVIAFGIERIRRSRLSVVALSAFGLYVAWSYLSIAWAQSPGDALQGSNRALLYLFVFALFLVIPWTPGAGLLALLTFVLGVGAVAIALLLRLASADHVSQLVLGGRLLGPTGYFNASVALFTIDALVAIVLAAQRSLPGLVRGALIAVASAGLQLALIGQSRGWLFTLPLVVIITFALVTDRLRVAAAAVLPVIAVLIPLHRLLGLYSSQTASGLDHAAGRAGQLSVVLCVVMFVVGTLLAWGEGLIGPRSVPKRWQRAIGGTVVALAVIGCVTAGVVATHGDPFGFVKRQWNGFVHSSAETKASSNFAVVGSGRYDFWRVAVDAVIAHPIGGLGQDNFADYYIKRGRTGEEPEWTHSIEMRLLAHTGLVGFGLFAAFLAAAVAAALRVRRRGEPLARTVAGAAMLPLVVWLVHGSIDWFWEMPALTGPALGFLAMAGALGERQPAAGAPEAKPPRRRVPRAVSIAAGAVALLAATFVIGLPYLSVREVSTAGDLRSRNPAVALRDLTRAADLNPLSADPGRLGGTIALQTGQFMDAERRFGQAIAREPGDWFSWLGRGLAASALGDEALAQHDFAVAASINRIQPPVTQALARVNTLHPLTPSQAFQMLVLTG
jgi:hypothetical protein